MEKKKKDLTKIGTRIVEFDLIGSTDCLDEIKKLWFWNIYQILPGVSPHFLSKIKESSKLSEPMTSIYVYYFFLLITFSLSYMKSNLVFVVKILSFAFKLMQID